MTSARFQVFHRNYNKVKIPATVWISASRKTMGQDQTLRSPNHSVETFDGAYHWPGHQENMKASSWGATTVNRGNLSQKEPMVCANRSAGAGER